MKRTTCPSESTISFSTAFSRSSNSPRYLAPATSAPISRATIRLFFSPSGTSPRKTRPARPSTIAVLPTPGSPISTGLFLVRRDSTWITRRISSSRPIPGPGFPGPASPGRVARGKQGGQPGGLVGERKQEVLGGDELVAEPCHLLLRPLQSAHESLR